MCLWSRLPCIMISRQFRYISTIQPSDRLRKGEHSATGKPQTCTGCGESLRASFFKLDPKTSSGRRSVCAACESDRRQELRDQQVTPTARAVQTVRPGSYCYALSLLQHALDIRVAEDPSV